MNFILGGAATHFQQMETLMSIAVLNVGLPNHDLPCDKCGQLVPRHNSVIYFSWFLSPLGIEWGDTDRHLLPVEGAHPCLGSPSRSQYLPGQPRHARGEYGYHQDVEKLFREAFAALLKNYSQ